MWREEDGRKQPYFFARQDGKPLMFAGVWDYSDVKGDIVPSFAILTDEPNALVGPYHDRMPVVLENVEPWLDVDTKLDAVTSLGPEHFTVRPVNRAVNKVSEKGLEATSAQIESGRRARRYIRRMTDYGTLRGSAHSRRPLGETSPKGVRKRGYA